MKANPEQLLVSAVIRTGDITTAIRHGASKRLFHSYQQEWAWIESQWDRSRKCPSKSTFLTRFPEFQVWRTDDVSASLELVKKNHARLETHGFVEDAVKLIESGQSDEAVRLISVRSRNLLYEIEHNADAVDIVDNWEDTLMEVSARVARVNERGYAGVPTSIASIDKLTGGLQEGWLAVVGARLGVGKTWTLIRMAYGAVVNGFDALYFSLEQNRHQIAMRMQGLAANDLGYSINPAKLTQGVGIDLDLYKQALDEISSTITGKFHVNDVTRGRVTVHTIESAIEAKQPNIVFVDYLTLLNTVGTSGSDWQDIGQLTADLKLMAEQYNIPVVVASQLSRGGTGRDPGPEHLARADTIGQDADFIITVVSQTEHVRRMRIVKNRHGPDGVAWYMHFDPSKGIFEEVTGNKAEAVMDSDLDAD